MQKMRGINGAVIFFHFNSKPSSQYFGKSPNYDSDYMCSTDSPATCCICINTVIQFSTAVKFIIPLDWGIPIGKDYGGQKDYISRMDLRIL